MMQNSSYNFEDFDISDASVSIPKFGANRANNDATSTPYPTRKSNNFVIRSPITGYGLGKFGKESNSAFDSKLDGVDFAISESDNQKFVPGRDINRPTNILSPQVTSSEMKRHFNDFSSAFPNNNNNNNNINNFENKNFGDEFSFDRSIEVGRSNKPNFYGDNKLFSFSNNSPQKIPGSLHQGNSPLPFEKRYPFYRRSDSNHEKVTSSSSSPKEPKISTKNFKIPKGYGDDASFFESLGLKNPLSKGTDYDKKKSGAKTTVDPISLPDISGLSSIFSSEESARNKGHKKENTQHKVLKNFPLDSDEKALFSALSNFQASITKLEEEKRKAYLELERMRDDQQLLKDDYKKLRQELVNARQQIDYDSRVATQLEQKARKYKSMAASLKDYSKSLEDSMKNGTPQDVFELRQRLESMSSKYMALNEENDSVLRMLSDRDYDLAQRRTEIRNLQTEVSRLKNELATGGFKSGNNYTDNNNENPFNRPISSSNRQYATSRRPVSRIPSGYNPAPFTAPGNNPEYQPYNTNPPAEASKPNVQFMNPGFGPQQQQQSHYTAQQGINEQFNNNEFPAGSSHYNANSINGNNPFSNQAAGNGQYPNNNFINNDQTNNPAFNGNGQYNTADPQHQQAGFNNPLSGTFNPLGNNAQVNQHSATNPFVSQTANAQSANFSNGVNQFNGPPAQPVNNQFNSQQTGNNNFPASGGQANQFPHQSQPLSTGTDRPHGGLTDPNGNFGGTKSNNVSASGIQMQSAPLFGNQIPPNNTMNMSNNNNQPQQQQQQQAFVSAPPTQPFDHVQPRESSPSRPSVQNQENLTNLASQLLDLLSAKIIEKGGNGAAPEAAKGASMESNNSVPESNPAGRLASTETVHKDEIEIIREKLEELLKLHKDKVFGASAAMKKKKQQRLRQVLVEEVPDTELTTSSEEEDDINSSYEEDETDADFATAATKRKVNKKVNTKVKPVRIMDRLKSLERTKRECKDCQLDNATPHHLHTHVSRPHSFPMGGSRHNRDDDVESWTEVPTPRPSAGAEESVRMVVEHMIDEFNHLKTLYADAIQDYNGRNPALGQTKRHAIAQRLKKLVDDMESKADQIYAMCDVAAATNIDIPETITAAGQPRGTDGGVASDTELMGRYKWID